MSSQPRSRLIITLLLLLFTLLFTSIAAAQSSQAHHDAQTVASFEFLGEVTFPTGTMFNDTEVGGLSGIVYDSRTGLYYALADDRSEINDARYYTLAIDVSDGSLDDGDVTFVRVTTILDENGDPFATGSLDPEGLALTAQGTLIISSEGDAGESPPINPFIKRFARSGWQNGDIGIPDIFIPNDGNTVGIRDNLAFESLTITPNQQYLVTATENALAQDGPATDVGQESWSRILVYDWRTRQPVHQFVYVVGEVPEAPDPPDAFRTNGLVDLLPLDNSGNFLAMERAFSVGQGNTVGVFEVGVAGATDVSGYDDLFDESTGTGVAFTPVSKDLVFDVEADFGVAPDNIEGMTFGPMLPDGRQLLILVSDNNFNPANQLTQFIAVAVELAPAP